MHKQTTQLRLDGVRDALAEAGLTLAEENILEGDYEMQSGFDAMQRLLSRERIPTAVFAFDDPMAIGAICAATQAGYRVPEDISFIGYDDVEMARFASPPLTTIRHPKAELGQLAVELLVSRVRNKELTVEALNVQPELVIRNSVAPPRPR